MGELDTDPIDRIIMEEYRKQQAGPCGVNAGINSRDNMDKPSPANWHIEMLPDNNGATAG